MAPDLHAKSEPVLESTVRVLLLFSPRSRIRGILAAALVQCGYRVLEADSSKLAAIKASQFLPDLLLADITPENSRDLLLIARLRKAQRTRLQKVLIMAPPDFARQIESTGKLGGPPGQLSLVEFPFIFADFIKRIMDLLGQSGPLPRPEANKDPVREIGEKLFDLQIPASQKLRLIAGVLHKQWAFPYTVVKALDILECDSSCCEQLGSCIETDQGAATAILKVANTVFYAGRERKKTSTVRNAVVRLGFRETRNLLACLALIDLSPEIHKQYGFNRQDFWLHSLTTALIAEKLCENCGFKRPELAFLAALVHDIGKIPLDNDFSSAFDRLLETTANRMGAFYDTEEMLIGFSHAVLSHHLLSVWNFPSAVAQAALWHHSPCLILAVKTRFDRLICEAVFTANTLAKALGLGHSCDEVIDEIPLEMLQDLGLPKGPDDQFLEELFKSLRLFCQMLGLSSHILDSNRPHTEPAPLITVITGEQRCYHPLISALQAAGFSVATVAELRDADFQKSRVALFLPGPGTPPPIYISGEEQDGFLEKPVLKIFLVDAMPNTPSREAHEQNRVVFVNRRSLDFRALLHTLDQYLATGGEEKEQEEPGEDGCPAVS